MLYASDSPVGAVAEAFGNHAVWTPDLFRVPAFPDARRALASYEAHPLKVLDLDDARCLLERELRPSDVLTRDRDRTQRWSLAVFREHKWNGIRWWSLQDPDRGVVSPLERLEGLASAALAAVVVQRLGVLLELADDPLAHADQRFDLVLRALHDLLELRVLLEELLEEARAHLAGGGELEEIRFVLFGEPAYRVFDMVNDAARVAEQMERIAAARRSEGA